MRTLSPAASEALPESGRMFEGIKRWLAKHPVWFIVLIATTARTGAILITTLVPAGTFALDDSTYIGLARAMANGDLSSWGVYEFQLSHQTLTFLWPLKSLFQVFGAHDLLGQFYVAVWGVAAAALVTLIATRFLTRGAAIFAGLVVALLPSEVLWSSLILKDAAVWAVLVLLALLALMANRADSRRLTMIAVALGASLFGLAFLRQHTLVVACWSLPVGLWFGRPALRSLRVSGGIAFALLVPVAAGLGFGGWRIATDPNLAERRVANAQGAESGFVEPGGNETAAQPPPVIQDDSVSANITHLPRGLTVMLFEPVPWRQSTSSNVSLARWEMLLWYPLLLLAAVGIRFSRRYLAELAFPLLVGLGMLLVYALAEGNIGTAYRHRGEFVWVVALLAALGAQELTGSYRRNREPPGEHDGAPSGSTVADGTDNASGFEDRHRFARRSANPSWKEPVN